MCVSSRVAKSLAQKGGQGQDKETSSKSLEWMEGLGSLCPLVPCPGPMGDVPGQPVGTEKVLMGRGRYVHILATE